MNIDYCTHTTPPLSVYLFQQSIFKQSAPRPLDPLQPHTRNGRDLRQPRLYSQRHQTLCPLQDRLILQQQLSKARLAASQAHLPQPHTQRYECQDSHDPLRSRRRSALLPTPRSSHTLGFRDLAGADVAEDRVSIARASSERGSRKRTGGRQSACYVADD